MSEPVTDSQEDPLLRRAKKEMAVAAALWGAALVWTVGYCVPFGYDRTAESFTYVLGFPDWVFWGLILPWGLCTIASMWFGLFFMRDHSLEEAVHVDDLREAARD